MRIGRCASPVDIDDSVDRQLILGQRFICIEKRRRGGGEREMRQTSHLEQDAMPFNASTATHQSLVRM